MDTKRGIRAARKAAGLTQEQLAQKSGVATITIRQYETGKRQPRIAQLNAIAAALGVEISDLLTPAQEGTYLQQWFEEGSQYSKVPFDIHEKYGISLNDADNIVKDIAWAYRHEFCTQKEKELREYMSGLNAEGKLKAFDYAMQRAEELSEIPKYQKGVDEEE